MSTASPARQAPTIRSNLALRVSVNWLFAASAIGVSSQSVQLQKELTDLNSHFSFPESRRRQSRRSLFNALASKRRTDTQWLSSTSNIAMHPAYQTIIGMGSDALPTILDDLRANSGHWYWALKAISNEDPVVPADRGSIKSMRRAWLRWGAAKGFIRA